MRAGWRRLILWLVIGLLLLGGLALAFRPKAVAVDFVEVSRGRLIDSVLDQGQTRVRDVFALSAPVGGRMLRIEADVGDAVTADKTVVARIEPSDPAFLDVRSEAEARAEVQAGEAALALARGELDQARAELAFARSEVARARQLIRTGAIPQRRLDDAESTFRSRTAGLAAAEAAVSMRRFQLQRARARLMVPGDTHKNHKDCECVPVRSPVDGRILRILNESEGIVAAGERLVEIGDPENLEIVADFLSTDAVRVEDGMPVLIENWGGPRPLNGKVRRVEPYGFMKVSALGIEEQRVNIVIDLTDPYAAWRRLGHGYRVETRIVLWQGEDILRVPISALFREGGEWAVFVADQGRARLRRVVLGRRNDRHAEITDGVGEGDLIVRHPSRRLYDGVRIEQRPD
jgi:HlyD family secretion protein